MAGTIFLLRRAAIAEKQSVLTYEQAVHKLGADLSEVQRRTRYLVKNAVDDYVAALQLNSKTAKETERALKHYILGFFDPDRPLLCLRTEMLTGHDLFYAAMTSRRTSGCRATIFKSVSAAPEGWRRPCSHCWRVLGEILRAAAN